MSMQTARLPRAAKCIAVCALIALGALFSQGCGDDAEPAAAPARDAAPNPYAALDAKFPEGRPAVLGPEERAQDPAYLDALSALQAKRTELSQTLAAAQAKVDAFRKQYATDAAKRIGRQPTEEDLDASLHDHAHYQSLLKAVSDAQAALAANRAEAIACINAKRLGKASEYDALRRQADRAALAAGLPARDDAPAQPAAPAAQPAEAPKPAVPETVEALSKATGIPVAPKAN